MSGVLDGAQTGLDVLGMIPAFGEIADGINGLIYAARGDYVNAGLSAAAMVPFAGWAATAGKFALAAAPLVKLSKKGAEATVNGVKLTTSSQSKGLRKMYTIYDANGDVWKYSVTGVNGARAKASKLLAPSGSTLKLSPGTYPKYEAHIYEKYLRSVHYHNMGNTLPRLDGMEVPYPVNFTTGQRIKP